MNLTFPCTTTLGGASPGRPCVFPVIWNYWNSAGTGMGSGVYNSCLSDMGVEAPACYTKAYGKNNTVDSKKETDVSWGYCPKNCHGETATNTSQYNLARAKYTHLWTSALYDLNLYVPGYCHTYDPPLKSEPDLSNRIYFRIIKPPSSYVDWNPAHDVYIHQKGQFWPRSDMISFGQPERITIKRDELELFFSIKEVNSINRFDNQCIEDENYSFTNCLQQYASKKSNCSVNFFGLRQKMPNFCNAIGLKLYIKILKYLKQEKIAKIKIETGCSEKCKILHYTYEKNVQNITWNTNWRAEVYIQPKSSIVDYSAEYYSFDLNDLISSVGGNLGLFLGWSFLTIIEAFGFLLVSVNVGKYLKKK